VAYFCSAYAGYEYHTKPAYWVAGITIFTVVSVSKMTEMIHGVYFGVEVSTGQFASLHVDPTVLFWSVLALSYGIVLFGCAMLFVRFHTVRTPTKPLAVYTVATGLSAAPTVVSFLRPEMLAPLRYEPLGFAIFIIGALYVSLGAFESAQSAEP
jgi:uncharacterized membrane protein YadS